MGLFYCCCCTILVLVNIVYMLIGIALLVIGILFMVAKDIIVGLLEGLLNTVFQSLKTGSGLDINIKQLIGYVISALGSITTALIVIGAIFFIISIIGMTSVCCKSKVLVILFLTILSIIVLIQIIVVIIYAADPSKFEDMLVTIMKPMIIKYDGFLSKTPESFIMNTINIALNCCGAKGYQDFNESTNFNRTFSQTFTYDGKTETYNTYLTYPISCCQFKDFKFVNMNGCIKDKEFNNKDTGCIKNLINSIKKGSEMALQIVGGIIGYQLLIILATIVCLVSIIKEAGVKPV